MYPTRTNVSERRCQVRQKFMLYVEIPLHYVIALWMGLNVRELLSGPCGDFGGEDVICSGWERPWWENVHRATLGVWSGTD